MKYSVTFKVSLILGSVFTLFLFSLAVSVAHAQNLDPNVSIPGQIPEIEEQIDITQSPEVPKPYEKVLIELAAYGTNLDQADISWSINGKPSTRGAGIKSFTFFAGAVGEKTTITIDIKPFDGPVTTRTVTVTPEEVDLLWSARTYTPPFYKGKALYTPEASLIFTAIPNFVVRGKIISPEDIVYTWSQDYTVLGSLSGRGRNTLSFTGSILSKPSVITVDAMYAGDASVKGSHTLTVSPIQPEVLFYDNHPQYGILFNKSLEGTFLLANTELKVSAFPYFYSALARNDSTLSYKWQINSADIVVPTSQSSVVFRVEKGQTGKTSVSALVESATKLLQSTFSSLSIQFGLKNTSGLFGQ